MFERPCGRAVVVVVAAAVVVVVVAHRTASQNLWMTFESFHNRKVITMSGNPTPTPKLQSLQSQDISTRKTGIISGSTPPARLNRCGNANVC